MADNNQESNEMKISTEAKKTELENSELSEEKNNIIINVPKNAENNTENTIEEEKEKEKEENSETLTIKPKMPKSDFENHIIKAYKKLIGLDISSNEKKPINPNENEENEITK